MSSEYPKIDTLFERHDITHKVDPTKLKNPAYGCIDSWLWTEKIDGMNMRVVWDPAVGVRFAGRADSTAIPGDFYAHLTATFRIDKLRAIWPVIPVTLYGEGYGPGIQRGGGYGATKRFILFDVKVKDEYWLNFAATLDAAMDLGIDSVPLWAYASPRVAVAEVRRGFMSRIPGATCQAEGLVGRTLEPLFDSRGRRLIVKLKTKDF